MVKNYLPGITVDFVQSATFWYKEECVQAVHDVMNDFTEIKSVLTTFFDIVIFHEKKTLLLYL